MRTRVLLVTALVLVAAVAMGCQPIPMAQPQIIVVTATPAPEPPAELPIALTVVGPSETVDLTLGGLKGLTAVEGWAGLKSSTGKIYPPAQYQGVSLQELAALVGGLDESLAITVEAEDGYAMTFSYAQIMDGAFVTFDPGTGDEKEIEDSLTVLVAYERDGEPLPEKSDGTLRLVIVNDSGGQVTDGHWAVKWVRKVTLKPVVAEWFLRLEGALVEDMDRGTFESGSAPGCHGESWTDSDGHVWTGIPLWLLVGRVDDERKHDRRAFNEQLAEEGYTIEVIASDGFSATFESQRIAFDDTIIVAYLMDDAALTEKDWPLRLVGPELSKREQVGGIAQIVLSVPAAAEGAGEPEAAEPAPEEAAAEEAAAEPEPTAEPTEAVEAAPAAASEGGVSISGAVESPYTVSFTDLAAMAAPIAVEHPKKGPLEYTGVPLRDLLTSAKPAAEAASVVFTASDGYTAELPLVTVQGCEACLVALNESGTADTVMGGMETQFWVKEVVEITVK